jgi:sulfonate dioxygenase
MAPNTTDDTTQQFEKLDLKKLAREAGDYKIFPKKTVS